MTLPGMKTLAFLLILSCAACTEMKPMSDFGMAVYNGKPEPLENYRGRFKVGAIVAPEEPETFRSAVELSLSENQLLAPDIEKERYVIDVNFEIIDSTGKFVKTPYAKRSDRLFLAFQPPERIRT